MRRRPGGAIGVAPSKGSPDACASRCRTVEPSGPAGSSRSITPSSAATSVASATAGFVTVAQHADGGDPGAPALDLPQRLHPARYYELHGPASHFLRFALRTGRGVLARGRRRETGACRGNCAGDAGWSRAAGNCVRAGTAMPGDHRQRPRRGRCDARGRRAHAHVRHRPRALGRRFASARRGVRFDPPRLDLRRHPAPRSALVGRNRGGRHTPFVKQIYPASITSKSFAAGGSVLDHKFGQSDAYTLGVEEEYMLLDPETFDLVQHIDTVLEAMAGHEFEAQVNPELMQSVLEVATPVCRTPADVDRALRQLRAYVTGIAQEQGLRVGSAGTHPFSLFERQRITARDRYRNLVDQMQYVARRELIFGLHVHVAVANPDTAIQVVNGLLAHLASLLALSASSPFWRGEPTGLASARQMVFAAFPRSGPPPRFRDYAEYAEVVGQLEKTGCIADYTHIWWDIRPHPRLGTVEVRICDAVTRLEDAIAITAYIQSLVKHFSERAEAGEQIPTYHRILTTENKWLAGRYGLEAPVMDLATGKRNRIPVAQLVRRTLKEIEPHARDLGSERELDGIREILARGNGADRQLRIFNANRDIVEVVREIADATEVAPDAG